MVWEGKQEVRGLAGGQRGGLVPLGDSVTWPEALYTFEGIKGSPDATMRFEIRDGRPECVEISIKAKPDGRGIRSTDLAMIRVDELTTDVFAKVGNIGVRDPEQRRQTRHDVAEARAQRRGSVTRAELEQVAAIYREHIGSGPTRAVQLLGGYSARTAARRVQQARAAGLLPPTTPGKRRA